MNTTTVVIFGVGGILIYVAAKGDGAGGYNPITLMRNVLTGKYKGGVPARPKPTNPSGFDLRPTATDRYYNPMVPV